jgi:hypothetical protein
VMQRQTAAAETRHKALHLSTLLYTHASTHASEQLTCKHLSMQAPQHRQPCTLHTLCMRQAVCKTGVTAGIDSTGHPSSGSHPNPTCNVRVVLKAPPSVLFLRPKASRTSPSHSSSGMGGGGWRGSMRTTLLSTLGGGLKLLRPTLSRCDTLHTQTHEGGGMQAGTRGETGGAGMQQVCMHHPALHACAVGVQAFGSTANGSCSEVHVACTCTGACVNVLSLLLCGRVTHAQ